MCNHRTPGRQSTSAPAALGRIGCLLAAWPAVEIEVMSVQHLEHATHACHDDAVSFLVIAPPLPRPVLFDQFWADLTFVHWPVSPQRVAHLFPPGTRPDVFDDGLTYVALVPFVMRHTAVGTFLRLPYFGSFAETNVRLYSIDDAGRHGVLFRSLETPRLAVVAFTRARAGCAVHLGEDAGDPARRRHLVRQCAAVAPPRPAQHPQGPDRRRGRADAARGVAHGALGAHTRKAGRTWWVPNEHGPWPVRAAEILELEDDLLAAGGVEAQVPPARAVLAGRPCAVRQAVPVELQPKQEPGHLPDDRVCQSWKVNILPLPLVDMLHGCRTSSSRASCTAG